MKWMTLPLGPIQTNAYLLYNDKKEALIIDPGGDFSLLKENVQNLGVTPIAILLTHAHFDHIGAVEACRDEWLIPVYLHENEADWLTDPDKNGSLHFPMTHDIKGQRADNLITGEQDLSIGEFICEILETPGHSPGSVSFYFKDQGVVFSGDALFDGSIGRTDLYGGDQMLLIDSIERKLFTLPETTVVAPGHGGLTTIQREMTVNPFLT